MAIKHSTVTVGTSATLLTGVADAVAGGSDQVSVVRTIAFTAAADLFLGGPGVTSTAYGVRVASGSYFTADLKASDELYAVVATGTATQRVLHLGV